MTDLHEWLPSLVGHQLYLPVNHHQGFEFCGARARKGLRIVTDSNWQFEHYGDVILDGTRPSSPFDAEVSFNLPAGWNVISGASMVPGEYFRIVTRGSCALTFSPGNDGCLRIKVELNGTTLFNSY